ncbi:MAG: hypothetical protein ACOY30_12585 [Bacillota bacterium]
MPPGRSYSQDQIENACKHLENTFGTDFFKKGVEYLKDSDPCGSGMGREYGAKGSLKLLQIWNKAREELVYAAIQGYFRPGLHSAVIGALSDDLSTLEEIPGIEPAARGLLHDDTFDRAAFTLSVASGYRRLANDIVFSGEPGSFFVSGKGYQVQCFSTETFETISLNLSRGELPPAGKFLEIQAEAMDNSNTATGKTIFYYDITALTIPLETAGKILLESSSLLRPETAAIVLCKTHFPALAGGVYRKLSGYAVTNKKTPGHHKAEGLLLYIPE